MAQPLKVLYMLHDSRRSGVPAVIASLILSLDRSRVTPAALFAYDGVYARELRAAGVEVRSLGPRLPFIWRANRFLFNIYLWKMAPQADLIHVNSYVLAFSALCAKKLGAKVLLHLHEKPGRFGRLLVKAVGSADCVVFCAKNCADHYAEVPALRRQTIPNAVTVPETAKGDAKTSRPRIVMFGSINKNKGQLLLLQAFAHLNPDAELYFYGTVGLSARGYAKGLKEFVRAHDLSDRVFFPGPTEDAASVMRQAAILVHSSLNECMSISILEAMSHGLPVIANAIVGMDEIIVDGVNGFLVQPGDIEALSARIGQLLADTALRTAIGQAGIAWVGDNFNMAERAGRFADLYQELVASAVTECHAPASAASR
ncbi:MAG TPA: glycosyltransferase family 4 protein [Geomonas sp.]|nr:glycosyltransferase family 4 protein [Geomonas sp.]